MASKLLFPGGDLHHHLIHGSLCPPQSIYPNRHLDRFSCFRRSHGYAQMSAWQGSAVPCRLLHTGHRCRRQAATQVSHTATDGGATTSAIHCWTPNIRCAWPHGRNSLPDDLRAQQNYESFRQCLKPGFSPDTSVFSALETFVIIALYKSTFTIPYYYDKKTN